jgi:ATP/maltotriose-dependent transcriptional regulator MalT/DNA-binding SARP family transcriptional activator
VTLPAWLLESLLRPPEAPTSLVRPAWLTPFETWPPVQVLAAGAGSGKTVGLGLLLADAPPGWVRVWLSIEGAELDARGLFRALIAGVAAQVPGFGEGLGLRLAADEQEPRGTWLALLAELEACTLPGMVLALDDVHRLEATGSEALRALLGLLAHRPPGLRLLVSSRVQLAQGVAKLEAQGLARTLGPRQLHWSPAEVEGFLATAGVAPGQAAQASRLDGWPLGLAMLAQGLATPRAHGETPGGTAAIAAYLAEDVLAACEPPLRALLLRLALLPVVTPAAAHVLCPDLEVDVLLAQAEHRHLLLRLDGGSRHRLPGYLREVLQAELAREVRPEQVRAWHAQLAQAHAAWGHHEEALAHHLAAGNAKAALDAADRCFPAMRYDGRHDVIARHLDAMAGETVETQPLYWLWRGRVRAHGGDHDRAQAAYAQAEALAHGDAALRVRVAIGQANLALHTGDEVGLRTYLATADAHREAARQEDRADRLLLEAALAERGGDLLRMQHANEAVLQVPCGADAELIASHAIALRNLFSLAYHRGERGRARAHVGDLLAHASHHGLPAYALFAGFMRALLHLEEGEAAVAEQFFRALSPTWAEGLDWLDRCLARVALAEWHAAQGRAVEGAKELRLAVLALDEAGFEEARAIPLERLVWLHLRQDDLAAAEAVVADHPGPWSAEAWSTLSVHDATLALAAGRVWQLRGEATRAAQAFAALAARLEALEAFGHAARARLLEATALFNSRDMTAARKAHAAAERLAPGHLQAICPARAVWLELAPLREAAVPEAQATPPGPAPAPAAGPRLEIRALGTFEVRVDGVRIEAWPRRRAAQILQALALYPRGLTRPALAELFEQTEKDGGAMRTAWSALRKQLEPELGPRAASTFLVVEDDHVSLALDRVAYCDVHAFEAGVAEGRRLERSEPVEAARRYSEAVRHYRGPLQAEGCFEAEREALAERARAAWLWLADHHQRLGARLAAEAVLMDATVAAPDDEAVCLALMALQAAQGRPERVRITYWDHRKALAALRGVKPSEEVEARYRGLLGG